MKNYIEMEKYIHIFTPKRYCGVEVDEEIEYRFTKINLKTIGVRILILMIYTLIIFNYEKENDLVISAYEFWGWFLVISFISIKTLHPNIVIDKYGIKTYLSYGKWIKKIYWSDIKEMDIHGGNMGKFGPSSYFYLRVNGDELTNKTMKFTKYYNEKVGITEFSSVNQLALIVSYYARKNQINFKTDCIKKEERSK